jgi:hypothetical protein
MKNIPSYEEFQPINEHAGGATWENHDNGFVRLRLCASSASRVIEKYGLKPTDPTKSLGNSYGKTYDEVYFEGQSDVSVAILSGAAYVICPPSKVKEIDRMDLITVPNGLYTVSRAIMDYEAEKSPSFKRKLPELYALLRGRGQDADASKYNY